MEFKYPLLIDRIQSIFIDVIFLLILTFIAAALLDKFENPPDWIRLVLFLGLWALYEPICVCIGCTIGQYIKRIRVRSFSNEPKKINILMSYIRYIVKTLLGWLSFITINMNPEKRAIHDFVAGSVMIKV